MNEAISNQYTCVVIELDKLPKGILLLSNVTQRMFEEALDEYRNTDDPCKVLVLFGIDPSIETKAQYIEFGRECPHCAHIKKENEAAMREYRDEYFPEGSFQEP